MEVADIPEGKAPDIRELSVYVGLRADLDAMEKRHYLAPVGNRTAILCRGSRSPVTIQSELPR
jgi:hypothetical protein